MNYPYQKHHNVSGLDKTRLGGGFNINTDSKNEKVQTARFFLTEAKTDETEPISSRSEKHTTVRPKTSMKTNININTNNMKVKIRPSSAFNSKTTVNTNNNVDQNYATVDFASQMINKNKNLSQNGKELKKPRKKHIKTSKVQVKKQEEVANTTLIEFHNSQLSARRAKDDKKPSSALSKPSSALPNANWKPKSVVKPAVGPYFGPL